MSGERSYLLRLVSWSFKIGFHVLRTHPSPLHFLGWEEAIILMRLGKKWKKWSWRSILCVAQNPDVTLLWSKLASNWAQICIFKVGPICSFHQYFYEISQPFHIQLMAMGGGRGGYILQNMADIKLKHQASYGEAGMKSYFSSIFFTAFVFVFPGNPILIITLSFIILILNNPHPQSSSK